MKQKIFALLLVFSFVLTITGCKSNQNNSMDSKPSISYEIKNPSHSVGSPQKLISYQENLTYDMQFPYIGNSNIDQIILNHINEKVNSFMSDNADYKANGKGDRKELYSSYQTFSYGDNNLSVEIQYLTKDPSNKTEIETVETLVFNKEKLISNENVFRNNKIDIVSQAIKDSILSNEKYKSDFEKNSKGIPESIDAVKNFAFSGESVIFFYATGSILPVEHGVVSIEVPKEKIEEAFSTSSPEPFKGPKSSAKEAVEQGKPIIALTFDDGPMDGKTDIILDELEKYNAHATFFVVGNQAEKCPELLKRQIDLGCEIGNHTYSHASLSSLNVSQIENQINKTNTIVQQATGIVPSLVRPPYGNKNQTVKNTVKSPLILWDVDTLDWKTKNTNSTINKVLNEAADGNIILMHDIHDSTVEAIKTIIPKLINKGFYLATVSEMFEAKGLTISPGNAYVKAS